MGLGLEIPTSILGKWLGLDERSGLVLTGGLFGKAMEFWKGRRRERWWRAIFDLYSPRDCVLGDNIFVVLFSPLCSVCLDLDWDSWMRQLSRIGVLILWQLCRQGEQIRNTNRWNSNCAALYGMGFSIIYSQFRQKWLPGNLVISAAS